MAVPQGAAIFFKMDSETKASWIAATETFVKHTLAGAEAGHDWSHINRVRRLSLRLAAEEGADALVVELAALLHDIDDPKFNGGDEEKGPRLARDFLSSLHLPAEVVEEVFNIIRHLSYRGGKNNQVNLGLAYAVVRDADRLDAMGAIGIARTFNYGGFKGRALYDPAIPPATRLDPEAYAQSTAPTLNHFYEKLFLLREGMLTTSGRKWAEARHAYMQAFVDRFKAEWEGLDD